MYNALEVRHSAKKPITVRKKLLESKKDNEKTRGKKIIIFLYHCLARIVLSKIVISNTSFF